MISPRHLLITIATFGLIAALVFLYNKTEAVDLSERNEIVSLLRELQEIEGRWDIDVLRMRMEMDSSQMSAPNRTIAAQNALKALANAVPHINSPSLSVNLGAISRAITEKAELIEKLKAANDPCPGPFLATRPWLASRRRKDQVERRIPQMHAADHAVGVRRNLYVARQVEIEIGEMHPVNLVIILAMCGIADRRPAS